MYFNKKLIVIALILVMTSLTVRATYLESPKDTKLPPDEVTYVIAEPTDMQFLYENEYYKYYFRDSRDVFAVYDKRNGYTWKTGLDIPFDNEIRDNCDLLLERETPPTEQEILETCLPLEDRMNTLFEGIGNSLLTMEYYDSAMQIKRISSASEEAVRSTLMMVNNDPSHYRLDVTFDVIDVMVKVHIYFTDDGMRYQILDEEITGEDTSDIAAFMFTPFMGASGGQQLIFDMEEMDYPRATENVPKERIPGYIFVPDGSGALLRLDDYTTSLSTYRGDMYGADFSTDTYHYRWQFGYVPLKNPTLPLYGIAHGNRQAAFFAHATDGAEFMEIISSPHNNLTPYNYVYARFNRNNVYQQIYNQAGAGYNTLFPEKMSYDITMDYVFLSGDGQTDGYPADYVGMALKYRDILIENDMLHPIQGSSDAMPIRLDFIMADAMDSLIGTQDVVVTTIDQVKDILTELHANGVNNINSGVYGYQRGGITLGDKDNPNWSRSIGSKRAFEDVIKDLAELEIDLSLALNYSTIYEEQMSLLGNAAKHYNGWYIREHIVGEVGPVSETYFARPSLVASWIKSHEKAVRDLNLMSFTYEGITNLLYSDYGRDELSIQEVMALYSDALAMIDEDYMINGLTPNFYLWPFIDRYLQAPMFTSQYLIQTDTVPFLQLVLQGSMEVYASYANFSFYTAGDVLRMIDYNVFPSFMLTHDPSYELVSTNSSNFYSTEYILYQDMIYEIYSTMNDAYEKVLNASWIDREVFAPGVIVNTYDNGVRIVINYTDELIDYDGHSVTALNYRVLD